MFAGTVSTGAVVSSTVTVKLLLLVLFEASFALQFTCVVPRSKKPVPLSQLTLGDGSTMSVAVAAGIVTVAPPRVLPSTVMFAGTVSTGAVVSLTVTFCVAVPVLPAASVALQVTECVPTANGPTGLAVGMILPSTPSVAVAEPKFTAVLGPVASTVISFGAVTVGGVVSGGLLIIAAASIEPSHMTI